MDHYFQQDIESCLASLRNGEIILFPADNEWLIGADATNEKAIGLLSKLVPESVFEERLILVAHEREVLTYSSHPDPAVFDFLINVSQPTAIVYEGGIGISERLIAKDGTIPIRLIKENLSKTLIKRLRKPLACTKATFDPSQIKIKLDQVPESIKNQVGYIVRYREMDFLTGQQIQFVRWNHDGAFHGRDFYFTM